MSDLSKRVAELSAEKRELLLRQLSKKKGGIDAGRTARAEQLSVFPRAPRSEVLLASFAQERLWFLDKLMPGNLAYNIPAALRLKGPLKISALKQSFNEIIRRHEVLRTTFVAVDGQVIQVIAPRLILELPITDLREIT